MIEFVDIDHAQELDGFVTAHEWSHFMQTSLWGRVKSDWGWHGILCRGEDGKIRGTMAILQHNIHYTNTCLLYAPRGPIFDHTDFATFEELIAGARELAKRQKAYAIRIDPMFEEGSRGFMEETEKLALQDFTVEDIAQLHSLLERMHSNLQGKAPSGEQKPRLEY